MKPTFLFTLFLLVSTIVSKPLVSQERFEIDDEGNIILIEEEKPEPDPQPEAKPEPKVEPTPAPQKPVEAPLPAETKPTPKPVPAPAQKPPPAPAPAPAPQPAVEVPVKETRPPAPEAPASPSPSTQVSPSTPPPTSFPIEASVSTRTASLRATASDDARVLARLRQGDRLKLIAEEGVYFKAVFMIENQFPIEGWIHSESLVEASGRKIQRAQEQAYEAPDREMNIQTKAESFPELELKEEVEIPEPIQNRPPPVASKTEAPARKPKSRSPKTKKNPEDWHWGFASSLAWTQLSEKISSKIDGAAADSSFLDYDLDGFRLQVEGSGQRQVSKYQVGGRVRYAFSYFDSSVGSTNADIESSSVLAQFHQVSAEAFGRRSWIWKKIRFEPEAALGAQFQVFSVNQLRDRIKAQPVLFSDVAFFGRASLTPRVYVPYDLVVEPYLGLMFFYYFIEGPKQTTPDGVVRTGSPQISPVLLHYGASLAWELKFFSLPDHWVRFSYLYEDYSRKFSGEGNRGGLALEDASSKLGVQSLSLGYEYRF